jgi:hypothetical protein
LVAGIHLTAAVPGKSFATAILGRVTHTLGVVSMLGIDINATGGGDALTITGATAGTQLYLSDCVVYAYGADNAAELDVNTQGSSGIVFDNVNFRQLGTGVPINLLRGTLQGRSGTFWPVAQTTASLVIAGDGSATGSARAWLRDPDLFGKVVVTGGGQLQVWNGQIRSGGGQAIEDTSFGPITVANCSIQSTLAAGDVCASDGVGVFAYTQLTFNTPFQTMPSNTARAPGTDAMSTEVFTGQVSNEAEFAGSGGLINAKFATVVQNTAPLVVFDPQANGSIIIRRAGVLTISPTLMETGTTSATVTAVIRVNGVDVSWQTGARSGGIAAIQGSHHVRVAANDVVTVLLSVDDVETLPAGVMNQLSMSWTGVR